MADSNLLKSVMMFFCFCFWDPFFTWFVLTLAATTSQDVGAVSVQTTKQEICQKQKQKHVLMTEQDVELVSIQGSAK